MKFIFQTNKILDDENMGESQLKKIESIELIHEIRNLDHGTKITSLKKKQLDLAVFKILKPQPRSRNQDILI
jgi:hypothetical protein